jgi:hypothetical protein
VIDLEKTSLAEALVKTKDASEEERLRFFTAIVADSEKYKEKETGGAGHPIWLRDWALDRLEHVNHEDIMRPWPIEPHTWSAKERGRPIWGDNEPTIDIAAAWPSRKATEDAALARQLWRGIEPSSGLSVLWPNLYNQGAVFGVCGARTGWNKRDQRAEVWMTDARALAFDAMTVRGHRGARIALTRCRYEVGEVMAAYPEYRERIAAAPRHVEDAAVGADASLAQARDLGAPSQKIAGAAAADRTIDVVEMLIDPEPLPECDAVLFADALDGGKLKLEPFEERPRLRVVLIPDVVVLRPRGGAFDIVKTGPEHFSAQWWRNDDHWIGRGDYRMTAGLEFAMTQIAIRGHVQRVAEFFAQLVLPNELDIDRDDLDGYENPTLEPHGTPSDAQYIRFLQHPGASPQTLNFVMKYWPDLVLDILGAHEMKPDFLKNTTATAIVSMSRVIENRMRQKMRNHADMIEDVVRSLLRLTVAHILESPTDDRGETLKRARLREIDFRNIAIASSLRNPGALTKASRLASYEFLNKSGALERKVDRPLSWREALIDESEVAIAQQLKEWVGTFYATPANNPNPTAEPQPPNAPAAPLQAALAAIGGNPPAAGTVPDGEEGITG